MIRLLEDGTSTSNIRKRSHSFNQKNQFSKSPKNNFLVTKENSHSNPVRSVEKTQKTQFRLIRVREDTTSGEDTASLFSISIF